jgi:hypothetical protein
MAVVGSKGVIMSQRSVRIYLGSCHCGAVRLEIDTDFSGTDDLRLLDLLPRGRIDGQVPESRFRLLGNRSPRGAVTCAAGAIAGIVCVRNSDAPRREAAVQNLLWT